MNYKVIGLMSGTSLDGLDIAYCEFSKKNGHWHHSLGKAITVAYPPDLRKKLHLEANKLSTDLLRNDLLVGQWFGEQTLAFIEAYGLKPDFISSHGHTIFHAPEIGFTSQIGNGNVIMKETGYPVINDFRSLDVSLGGQGAPLVPVGDALLFPAFDACLNLGGIANLSFQEDNERKAYDVCPANMVLDFLCIKLNLAYDDKGSIAASGTIDEKLLSILNRLDFYKNNGPKSLGYEWVSEIIFPILSKEKSSIPSQLATFTEHIAQQIGRGIDCIDKTKTSEVLVTGGGAFNDFLIERIRFHAKENIEIIIPDNTLIAYKEALVFAFLGVLRLRNENNCLKSVTGAEKDNCGGILHGDIQQ